MQTQGLNLTARLLQINAPPETKASKTGIFFLPLQDREHHDLHTAYR